MLCHPHWSHTLLSSVREIPKSRPIRLKRWLLVTPRQSTVPTRRPNETRVSTRAAQSRLLPRQRKLPHHLPHRRRLPPLRQSTPHQPALTSILGVLP